jgi:electron transfer flavoprotein alpha subunit
MGHTTMGTDVAGDLSVRLGVPLVSSCQRLTIEDGGPGYVSLTCGGKVMAEGPLPDQMCLVTMVPGGYKAEAGQVTGAPEIVQVEPPQSLDHLRVKLRTYIEPETGDVDITKEPILVSVGRGLQQPNNLELAEAVAKALNGAVSASRPVVDQGWLPTSRMVGKSGKQVKPRLYLALGISGAPEHIEGVPDYETMVAVNTDEQAPIFDFAQYGATVDVLELMPALAEKIEAAKGK